MDLLWFVTSNGYITLAKRNDFWIRFIRRGLELSSLESTRFVFFFYWNSSEPSFAWLRARGNGMPRSAYQWGINDSLFFLRLRSDAIEILSNPTGSGSDVTGPIEESVDIHEVVQMTCYPIKTDTIHVKAVKSFEKKPYQIGFLFIQSQTKGEHSNLFFFFESVKTQSKIAFNPFASNGTLSKSTEEKETFPFSQSNETHGIPERGVMTPTLGSRPPKIFSRFDERSKLLIVIPQLWVTTPTLGSRPRNILSIQWKIKVVHGDSPTLGSRPPNWVGRDPKSGRS